MTLSYRNSVSIAELAIYAPALIVAIFLVVRHGFGRNAGWLFLVTFCLARIIGSAMELATISQPTNISLYEGYSILQNIGLSPLMLCAIALLSRLLENINKNFRTALNTSMLKGIETIMTVALILGIVGGIKAADAYQNTKVYLPSTLNKAGTALFIVSYLLLVLCTILVSFHTSHADSGEKRLMLAVGASLPFLAVRLVYSCLSTFAHSKTFNMLTGNVTVLLCLALIEELCVVVIFMGVGATLHVITKEERLQSQNIQVGQHPVPSSDSGRPMNPNGGFQKPSAGNKALNIAKRTIIGRIIMAFVPEKKGNDVEMQSQRY